MKNVCVYKCKIDVSGKCTGKEEMDADRKQYICVKMQETNLTNRIPKGKR